MLSNETEDILKIVTVEETENEHSTRFQTGHFSVRHYNFFRDHGLPFHRSIKHRLVVNNKSDQIVGTSALIPTVIWILNREVPALFWVEVYVKPEWRFKGVQRLMDQNMRQKTGLKIIFSNKLASQIYQKHGWSIREDFSLMLLPLIPLNIPHLGGESGVKSLGLQCIAHLLRPFSWLFRQIFRNYKPISAHILYEPNAEFLASIFMQYRDGWVTTNRTADFIRWRYLESPHRSQYTFFIAGAGSLPSLVLVSRTLIHRGEIVTRILDIFGNLRDQKNLSDILRLSIRDAINRGASQITILASNPILKSVLRINGFLMSMPSHFCWLCQNSEVMQTVGNCPCHWVLADSNKDSLY